MSDDKALVFFDLETTGFGIAECDVIQVAAVHEENVFDVYILPSQPIHEGASKVTGLTVQDGQLFHHGELKTTTPLLEALKSFITFVQSFKRPVLLVGHNAHRFDTPILSRVLEQNQLLDQFQEVVSGTLDTLSLSEDLYPDLESHKQESLVNHFLKKDYEAHSAVEDAKILQELFKHWNIEDQTVLKKHIL
ncbi:unnamed protein product [Ophioblennius macclurei]